METPSTKKIVSKKRILGPSIGFVAGIFANWLYYWYGECNLHDRCGEALMECNCYGFAIKCVFSGILMFLLMAICAGYWRNSLVTLFKAPEIWKAHCHNDYYRNFRLTMEFINGNVRDFCEHYLSRYS